MKIVYVCKVFAEWGGLERVWTDKMNALSELDGYGVWLLTTDQGSHPYPYPISDKVHCYDLNIRFTKQYQYSFLKRYYTKYRLTRLFRQELRRLIDEIQPDILICNTSSYVSALVQWKGNVPLIVESHGTWDRPVHMDKLTFHKRIQSWYKYWCIGKAQAVVALTNKDAENWKRVNKQSVAIPDIVHLNNSNTFSSCNNKRVIFVGRLDSQKGYNYLSEVWQIVSQRHPEWCLDIYGEGADKLVNSQFIPRGDNVYAHPQTADIMERYKESSILLLTSVYEPFGLVMPEAMSCGVPVVAFDCPYGPSDIVSDGEDGFLVPCFDVKTFALKVCLLMEDEALRKTMGSRAVISSQRFSKDNIIPIWDALFKRISNTK